MEFNRACINEGIQPNYTKFRYYDPAVTSTKTTFVYRKYLVNQEIEKKSKLKSELQQLKDACFQDIEMFPFNHELKQPVLAALNSILDNHNRIVKTKTIKKLNTPKQDSPSENQTERAFALGMKSTRVKSRQLKSS